MGMGAAGDLEGEGFLFFLEMGEADFDEGVVIEGVAEGLKEGVGEAGVAEF